MLLTLFVPTRNRAPFLESLFTSLVDQQDQWTCEYEILVSDNASEDETEKVCASFADRLPVRYERHEEAIPLERDFAYCLQRAQGKYALYCADDDDLDLGVLDRSLRAMEESPNTVALYAPHVLYDRVGKRALGRIGQVGKTAIVAKRKFFALLGSFLNSGLTPEMPILRTREAALLAEPQSDNANTYFTLPGKLLVHGNIIFSPEPFYYYTTRDDRSDDRGVVLGEVWGMTPGAWDQKKGGLEYLFALARESGEVNDEQVRQIRQALDSFVLRKLVNAIRLRIKNRKSYVETYYLAQRAVSLDPKVELPEKLQRIRSRAALDSLAEGERYACQPEQILLSDDVPDNVREYLEARGQLPVVDTESADPSKRTLAFSHGRDPDFGKIEPALHLTEQEVLLRFP